MTTFRAAYIAADASSNGVGVLLTTEDQSHLSDADLLAAAQATLEEACVTGKVDIVIGEWRE